MMCNLEDLQVLHAVEIYVEENILCLSSWYCTRTQGFTLLATDGNQTDVTSN
jgi:hypothetical protein